VKWNGRDLIDSFADLSGDRTTDFKAKIEEWINDIEQDIFKRHNWGFSRVKGKKILVASAEEQFLSLTNVAAPTLAALVGGSLTDGSSYKVLITHYDPISKNETQGTASAAIVPSGANLSITVSAIETSSEAYFTQRRVYLSKDGGKYYLYSTITNQTDVTTTITANVSSRIIAPDFNYIAKIDGNPFYESNQGQLDYMPVDQLRLLFSGAFTGGVPEYWSGLDSNRILLYPYPNATTALSFYYLKAPRGIYYDYDSIPSIPYSMKNVLEAGVEYKAYKFRDRDGYQTKYQVYEGLIKQAIDDIGSPIKTVTRVRDTIGDTSGWSY
jgi:hypothetical protein